ncbi:hypothetical protein ACFWM7_01400 [Streptomyces sp. NPDC058375]|uniref:hypothetical protein n=1 Tax=Streptomyces sp. NPDC058375 TaxID=3346467 RepID=UPI00365897E5
MEIAAQHLSAAVEQAQMSSRVDDVDLAWLKECLADAVQEDGCHLWNPYAGEEDSW